MKTLITKETNFTLFHHTGVTKFTGCQCIKNCTCNEDFISKPYNYYTVSKTVNKPKTTYHNTLVEALERCEYLKSIINTNNKKYQKPIK